MAIRLSGDRRRAEKNTNPHLAQMGTTVVMAIIWENRLVIANVGDSRAYLWKDHSLVQELINIGTISSADAHQHQHRNQLTRAVGISVSVNAEIRELELDRDSLVFLCTGGLTEYLDDQEIASELDPEVISCTRLIIHADQSLLDCRVNRGRQSSHTQQTFCQRHVLVSSIQTDKVDLRSLF